MRMNDENSNNSSNIRSNSVHSIFFAGDGGGCEMKLNDCDIQNAICVTGALVAILLAFYSLI